METTWSVAQLERNTSDGFVVTVHYRVNARREAEMEARPVVEAPIDIVNI